MPALVRLVTGVRPDVLLQMGQLCEFSLTNLTPGRKRVIVKGVNGQILCENSQISCENGEFSAMVAEFQGKFA